MERNKVIIGVLIVVIIALLVGIFAGLPNLAKQNTDLAFKGKSTITEGDYIKIKLTDGNGTAIANQTVNVTIVDGDQSGDSESVVTDDKGVCRLKMDKGPGKYEVIASYGGGDKYNGCNDTKKITVEEKVVEAQTESNYDSGAFYSPQAGRVIYTGEIHDAPDGGRYKHLGNNEWVPV